jgi:hypothetical protein
MAGSSNCSGTANEAPFELASDRVERRTGRAGAPWTNARGRRAPSEAEVAIKTALQVRLRQLGRQAGLSRSASEGLYLNFNGAVLPAGTVLNIFVEWTEENTNT